MDNPIDGTGGRPGHGFMSASELKEIDIGHGDNPKPTYISAKLNPEYKPELINLLEVVLLNEMLGLDRSIVQSLV